MRVKELIDTLHAAGISLTEASKFLPVSRATLHNWKSEKTQGDPFRVTVVAGYVKLIRLATQQKRLPLSTDVHHADRVAAIRRVLSDIKNNIK